MLRDFDTKIFLKLNFYVYVATIMDPHQKDKEFLKEHYKRHKSLMDPNGSNTPQSYQSATVPYTHKISKYDYAVSELRKLVAKAPASVGGLLSHLRRL
jgi:hypothetical protein